MSTDCIFCKIAKKEIPAKVVAENDQALAFVDLSPQAPTHVLVIPKKHISKVSEAGEADQALLGSVLLLANQVALEHGIQDYRMVINNGESAGQTVFHLHLHLLAGRKFNWPPG